VKKKILAPPLEVILTKLTSTVSFLLYPPSFSLILKALGYVFLFNNDNFDNFYVYFLKKTLTLARYIVLVVLQNENLASCHLFSLGIPKLESGISSLARLPIEKKTNNLLVKPWLC
jgi:hypothetical protein